MSYTINFSKQMSGILHPNPNMLKSTKEKMERQSERDSKVAFFEAQKENLKNMKTETVEDIAKKLEMFHTYEDEIAAAKQEYNSSQMFHIMDEAEEEAGYLLLFGELPDAKRLGDFKALLAQGRTLPTNFTRDVIMKAPTHDMMNSLSRSVLTLASYDSNADDISLPNVLRQCLMLISVFPMLAVYSYHAYNHYECGGSMYIHYPSDSLSTASNFLRMLRPDMQYTPLEASVLDLALVLHMEHGGGNNSSFTTHVVTSSGTDTYSAISAALGSLKGPKHGGANYKVVQMFEDMKKNVSDTTDEQAVADYLVKLLRREAFDQKGLIYGMGHAVYSISDPRAQVFKSFVGQLAHEKGRDADFALYTMVEEVAPRVIAQERHIYKGVSANVDFYSGFVYSMLGLPPELYTPVFAMARIVGWSAHRLEELINTDKIIRPAYRCVQPAEPYISLKER